MNSCFDMFLSVERARHSPVVELLREEQDKFRN